MRVLLAGGSGFLGTALRDRLARRGHEVTRLVRGDVAGAGESRWDPYRGTVDPRVVEAADVVVNAAGSPLAGNPHSATYRRTLRESRVRTTRTLAEAIARSDRRPAFLAQNGTSFYGDRGDEVLAEESGTGEGSLLTDIARDWQAATEPASEAGARVCVLRTGAVLHRSGGAFQVLHLLFRLGLGGPLGSGEQYFPIVPRSEWVRAATFLLENESCDGVYNLVAPDPPTNAEFTAELGRMLHRPTLLRVPAPVIRRAAGQLAGEVLGSFRVQPARLQAAGFEFETVTLRDKLTAALTAA